MSFIYSLFISIFNISLKLNSLFNEKTKKIVLGRKKTINYIKNNIEDEKVIWIHVASVGEFEQAKPIIDSLKIKYEIKILVSYFSSSTESAVSNYKNVDFHFYML